MVRIHIVVVKREGVWIWAVVTVVGSACGRGREWKEDEASLLGFSSHFGISKFQIMSEVSRSESKLFEAPRYGRSSEGLAICATLCIS